MKSRSHFPSLDRAIPAGGPPSAEQTPDSAATRWARTQQFERILVPVDFSEDSLRALAFAIPLVRQSEGSMVLLHVVGPASYLEELTYVGLREVPKCNLATQRMTALTAGNSMSGISVECRVETGIVFDKIAEVARETKADLIILAGHNYSTLEQATSGGTVERVIRCAPCPIFVVRGSSAAPAPAAVRC